MGTRIIVAVRYTVKDGKRGEFYGELTRRGVVAASRAEEGNEKYDYYYPLDSENDLCLMEIWESREAQKAHGETPHFKILAGLKAEFVENTALDIYSIQE